jgi:hypothetical protein
MAIFVGVPFWLVLVMCTVGLPFLVVYFVVKLVLEFIRDVS